MKKYIIKKGFTLIEILISISILFIIIIPLSNLIISSTKMSKSGEEKQQAVTIAQQIIEEIKGIPDFNSFSTYGITLNKVAQGKDEFYGNKVLDEGYIVDIHIKPINDLSFYNKIDSNVVYDVDIFIEGTDNDIRIKKVNDVNVNYAIKSGELIIDNNISNIKITYGINGTNTFEKNNNSFGKVRVSFGANTNINNNFIFKASNYNLEPFEIYIEVDSNAHVNYSMDNNLGKIRKYFNIVNSEESSFANKIYDIEVSISKNNKQIYKAIANKVIY